MDIKEEKYNPYHTDEKELIEPFKTLNKGFDWLLDLATNSSETLMIIPSFLFAYFGILKTMRKVYKDTVKDLTDSTSLTKKQAKKIVKKSLDALGDAYDRCDELKEGFGYYETELIMVYSIRSDKALDKEVHQNCDIAVESILRLINNEESEVWLTIAYKKELEVLIEKYMSRFDKRRESKKYNGIWY